MKELGARVHTKRKSPKNIGVGETHAGRLLQNKE